MGKPTVYLDSTVPSYWLAQGSDPILHARHLLTRRWWSDEIGRFQPFVSQLVLEELSAGDRERAAQRLGLIAKFPLLRISHEVEAAAQFYIDHVAMPKKDLRDAFHLALASVYSVEYLVTWNYSHLANASKRKHIAVLNQRLSLHNPIICTPEELFLESE